MIFITILWASPLCGRLLSDVRGVGLRRDQNSTVERLEHLGWCGRPVVVTKVT